MQDMVTDGLVADGFEPVAQAFARNFTSNGEVGAAIAVSLNGKLVVDLWGGQTGVQGAAWRGNTVINLYSVTKGIVATCFAIAASRDAFSYEDPVSAYWPEFGCEGKDRVTIGMMLSHQAGLCGFAEGSDTAILYDLAIAAEQLAAARPVFEPGTASGYHALTFGFLANALFQRIEGRDIAEFVAQELCEGLGLDLQIGLRSADLSRVADIMVSMPPSDQDPPFDPANPAQLAAFTRPPFDPAMANLAQWRSAKIPSANGHGTARALASLYAILANGGWHGDRQIISEGAIKAACQPRISGIDAVLGFPFTWAAGFMCNPLDSYGPGQGSIGHSGLGGAYAFADPDAKLSVGYVMNKIDMTDGTIANSRGSALVDAAYTCLQNL